MKLTNKLRTGALTASLGLVGLTGCAEFEEMADDYFESIVFEGAAAKLEEKGEYEKARAMRNIGNARVARGIAEAGRSEVNVNVNANRSRENSKKYSLPPENVLLTHEGYIPDKDYVWINPEEKNDLSVRKIQNIDYSSESVPEFFVANYWKDLNENRVPEVQEIVGYMGGNKRDFNQGENISFWIQNFDRDAGLAIEFKIYDPKGKEIYSNTFAGREKGMCQALPDFGGFSPDYFENKGTHLASYSINGKFKESIQFNIH